MRKKAAVSLLLLLAAAGAALLAVFLLGGVACERDIVYGQADGVDLKMDILSPRWGRGPFPAVVCIHGGAWQQGGKRDLESFARKLAEAGYVAATVDYRLAPAHKWPAQIEDVKCAVRFLRARAAELRLDPDNVFATGASAGGHLSLLLGLTDAGDGLEGNGGHADQSSAVRGVSNFFGPTDLRVWTANGLADAAGGQPKTPAQKILEDFLGTSDRASTTVSQVSPLVYVDPQDPPVLTFHGTQDEIVPYSQAELLRDALSKAGVPNRLVRMEGEKHGWGGAKWKDSIRQTIAFFDAIRNGGDPAAS